MTLSHGIANVKKTQAPLTTLKDIKTALTLGPVFADIAIPAMIHVTVKNVRKFKPEGLKSSSGVDDNTWTSLYEQGIAKGYEVQVLEGWRVPEKVYTEK